MKDRTWAAARKCDDGSWFFTLGHSADRSFTGKGITFTLAYEDALRLEREYEEMHRAKSTFIDTAAADTIERLARQA